MKLSAIVVLVAAAVLGLLIGLIDARPGWDDTGVTVLALLLASAASGMLLSGRIRARHAWIAALAVGMWIPVFEWSVAGAASLAAPLIALGGAYAGAALRAALSGGQRAE